MTDITRWEPQVKFALRKYARHYPRNEQDDVSQELYLHLLRNETGLLRIEDAIWQRKTVCVLLRNKILDYSRRVHRHDPPAPLEEAAELAAPGGDTNFHELLEGITHTEALVMEVLFKNGYTQKEAAKLLGRGRGWIFQAKKSALDKIRRNM